MAEVWLDCPAFGVMVYQHGGGRLGVAGGEAPRLLHGAGVDTDHRTDRIALRRRDPGAAQLARPARLADPFGRRPRLARGIGDVDVAAEADDVAEAKFVEECEQLVVA